MSLERTPEVSKIKASRKWSISVKINRPLFHKIRPVRLLRRHIETLKQSAIMQVTNVYHRGPCFPRSQRTYRLQPRSHQGKYLADLHSTSLFFWSTLMTHCWASSVRNSFVFYYHFELLTRGNELLDMLCGFFVTFFWCYN